MHRLWEIITNNTIMRKIVYPFPSFPLLQALHKRAFQFLRVFFSIWDKEVWEQTHTRLFLHSKHLQSHERTIKDKVCFKKNKATCMKLL